jgi:UDP-glucuronate decarboxylase
MNRVSFLPPFAELLRSKAAPVIITGVGGWLGQATLEMLESALGETLPEQVMTFATGPRTITLRSGRTLTAHAFSKLEFLETRPSIIFHFAFLTRGHTQAKNYIAVNRDITRIMRGFVERNGALGLVIPSSGAVYGPGRMLDHDLAGNPYGVLKHQDEVIFQDLASRLSFPIAITRIFNLAGAFINNLNSYALSSIIADVVRGGPITLRAAHPVWRSYTHVEDVLNIAAAVILRGLDVPVFDTAGESSVEIGDLANRVMRLLTAKDIAIIRPEWRNGTADQYLGDGSAYRRLAGLTGVPLHSLDQQIIDTAAYMANLRST